MFEKVPDTANLSAVEIGHSRGPHYDSLKASTKYTTVRTINHFRDSGMPYASYRRAGTNSRGPASRLQNDSVTDNCRVLPGSASENLKLETSVHTWINAQGFTQLLDLLLASTGSATAAVPGSGLHRTRQRISTSTWPLDIHSQVCAQATLVNSYMGPQLLQGARDCAVPGET